MAEVLICGATGFIGSYCTSAFHDKGWAVVGAGRQIEPVYGKLPIGVRNFQGDITDSKLLGDILNEHKPERIVFVAGPANVQQSFKDPVTDFRNHLLPLIAVLDQARRMQKPPGILLVSSAAVYGNPTAIPVSESAAVSPISPYGYHKLQQEILLDEFASIYGLPTCKARVFSTYGAGLRHLAIYEITKRTLAGDFKNFGTGRETRDYLHASDVGAALECIASSSEFNGEIINVASGQEQSIEKVAELIYETLAITEKPVFDGTDLNGSPMRWCADVSHLQKLGFATKLSFEAGMKETVEWIKCNA